MQGSLSRLFLIPFVVLPALALALSPKSGLSDKVLTDAPGKLEIEVRLPDVSLLPVQGQGMRALCALCPTQSQAGLPDLPLYHFTVLTSPSEPQVTVQVLESEVRKVPEGLASVPFTPTPIRFDYRPDAKAFRAASALSAKVGGIRTLRGLPVRGIDVPLALWSDNNKTLTLLKRIRIEVGFSGMRSQRAQGRLQGLFAASVKNPVGGAYLYSDARPRPLRKVAATPTVESLSSSFIKIRVGDKNIESFSEDQVYALSFSDLDRVTDGVRGAIIGNLRMFTGNNDTLPRRMDSTVGEFGTLREIPIEVFDKNGNNTFDEGDSIRFFAHGTSIWKRLPGNHGPIRYEFSADPYSFENYYFLDFSGKLAGTSLRLPAAPVLAAAPLIRKSTYAYVHAERDLRTYACDPSGHEDEETGFDWFWVLKNSCSAYTDTPLTLTHTLLFSKETDTLRDLDQSIPGDSIYAGYFVYNGTNDSIFKPYYGGNGDTLAMVTDQDSRGSFSVWTGQVKNAPAFPIDSVIWGGRDPRFDGFSRFEGYTISYRRKHIFTENPLWIFPSDFDRRVTYQVQGGTGAHALRIESGVATASFELDGQGSFTDSLAPEADAKYFIYKSPSALSDGSVEIDGLPPADKAVQNLLTGDGKNPDYIIIVPRSLLDAAANLKSFREQSNRALPLKTSVVLIEDIYRQFSSGRLTPEAVRNFLRWAYYNWGGANPASNPLKYVLLFGDGHYDFRNIKASSLSPQPPNHIPPFEMIDGSGRGEIATDDFFGWLDYQDNELEYASLDVSIGRIPVQSLEQAMDFVQKTKDNEDPSKGGEWRGRIVMSADDATQRGSGLGPNKDSDPISQGHTNSSEQLARAISTNEPGITIDKVYLLDYAHNSSYHKPEAAQDLITLINRGTLMMNYVGHGASNQLADEVLMQTNDALSRMHNQGKTPMINEFSCTVGRFESLSGEGMSEQFVKAKSIGAIAAISATRESFPNPNIALANAFYNRAFPIDSSGTIMPVGDALRDAKNSSSETGFDNDNDMKYALLGEPVLLLRKPQIQIAFTHVLDTVKALDCSTISGKVTGGTGNGFVNLKILAGSIQKIYPLPPGMETQYAEKRGNILFERTFPFKDGVFSTDYFIPKQIPFGDTNAQILVYAWDGEKEMEGSTASLNIHIHGTATSACSNDTDGHGPHISITGCERKETGGVDFPDHVKISLPYCLQIEVADTSGGVLSAEGPDEGTTVEIPGEMDPFHPQPGIDELYHKTYQVTLDSKGVRPGPHLLKVSARDGYGNISLRQMAMDITADSSVNTVTAYNAPNPMKRNGTVFYFSTVIPSPEVDYSDAGANADRLDFEIRIFNQTGNLVKVFQRAQSGSTSWDGRDEWGNLLANGVYFYKITARQIPSAGSPTNPSYRTLSSKRNILVISR